MPELTMVVASRSRNRVQKAFHPATYDLSRRVVSGAAFTFMGIAFRTVVTLGSMAVLARLLTPSDFGHIAMATVITELASIFANFGFGSILIQKLRISRIEIDTMHWGAMGLGVALTFFVLGLSFFAEHFFQDDMVGPLLRVLCLNFVLDEFTMAPRALMARRMQFKLDFYIQSGMMIVRSGTAIIMASNGMGVWSLAGGALAGSTLLAFTYPVLTGYWPRFKFSKPFLRSTWRTSGSYFGNGILFYINSSLDLLLVGRILGASMLGQYQNARSLTDEIRSRMVQPLQRVLFPAFSALQNDHDKFSEGILRSARLLALIFIPVGFGVAAVAPELVTVLYGEQWLPMIPILQVISIAVGLSAPATVSTPIFNATNRVTLSFKLYSIQTAVAIAFMLVGSQWGLMGVAWSRLALLPITLMFFLIALRFVKMRFYHLWQIVGTPLFAAGLMWLILAQAREFGKAIITSQSATLAYLIALGVIIYTLLSFVISPYHIKDAKLVVAKLVHGKNRKLP